MVYAKDNISESRPTLWMHTLIDNPRNEYLEMDSLVRKKKKLTH